MRKTWMAAAASAIGALVLSSGPLTAPAWAVDIEPAGLRSPIQRQVYAGVGDDVIRVQRTKLPGIATMSHTGQSNFIVDTLDLEGRVDSLLVNEIGSYRGTVAFNIEPYGRKGLAGLSITADGPWRVVIKRLSRAPRWGVDPKTGAGDAVLRLDPAVPNRGLHVLRARHGGPSNFIVATVLGGREDELLINEIGSYRGRVRLPNGTQYLTITAAGGYWRVARS